jgi:hypothetical protein
MKLSCTSRSAQDNNTPFNFSLKNTAKSCRSILVNDAFYHNGGTDEAKVRGKPKPAGL